MNSGTKLSPTPIFIAVGALLILCLVNQPGPTREGNAPSRSCHYENVRQEPKPKKQWYKYRVEIETTPENQIYQINKSGYQQYEVSRLGESYSYVVYEFTSDKVMTTEEAYEFVRKHPDQCTRVNQNAPSEEENIYDRFINDYDNYIDDPEDLENYPDEVFDFLID